jgi:hypothetical protein
MFLVPLLVKTDAPNAPVAERMAHAIAVDHIVTVGGARRMTEQRAARTVFDVLVLADGVELPPIEGI